MPQKYKSFFFCTKWYTFAVNIDMILYFISGAWSWYDWCRIMKLLSIFQHLMKLSFVHSRCAWSNDKQYSGWWDHGIQGDVIWGKIPYKPVHHCINSSAPNDIPYSKVHGANMGPIWGRQDPGGPHIGPMNFAIWDGSKMWQMKHIDGLEQGCSISIANALEILQSCTKPSIYLSLGVLNV